MDFRKDYYSILELQANATPLEIKKAYRTLAKKYHPDVNHGNVQYEEIIKDLNEAYAVLGYQENKLIYDQYIKSKISNPNLQKFEDSTSIKPSNRYTFIKKSIVVKNKKVYLKGEIVIKYFAAPDDILTQSINELYFKIQPTEVIAEIYDRDIHQHENLPDDIAHIFTTNTQSHLSLKNVSTKVISENSEIFYKLNFNNPIILEPIITDVTKHEGISYGTLIGQLYAILEFKEEHEVEETVTECYGATGKKDKKVEEGRHYQRLEYFNSNCTTYWGPWVPEIRRPSPPVHPNRSNNASIKVSSLKQQFSIGDMWDFEHSGCGIPLFALLILMFVLPQLGLISWLLVPLLFFAFFRNSLWLLNILFRLGSIVLTIMLISAIWSLFQGNYSQIEKSIISTPKENTTITASDVNSHSENIPGQNQVISHHRVWKDYSGRQYEGSLKILVSDYKSARNDHANMSNPLRSAADWSHIYTDIIENDKSRITMAYSLFDSIRNKKRLNRIEFAEMIVSCVQDIPYHIVLPNECNISLQNDVFVKNFLTQNPGLCLGNMTYGIQTPAEFLGNLKGDCDTRVAFLFEILNHYNYKVALLGSSQFRHSLLGIQLPGEGITMSRGGIKYLLWETTSSGFRPGMLSAEISDLNYWNFYLTNEL